MSPYINSNTLDIQTTFFFLVWLQEKRKISVYLVPPQRRTGDNTAVGCFALFWLCSCWIVRWAQINSRGQKFTSSLRGTLPYSLLFAGWHEPIPLLKRNTQVRRLCFSWWNISFTRIFQQQNTSAARRWTPQKGEKSIFNPFACSTFETSAC